MSKWTMIVIAVGLLNLVGCSTGPRTYPVKGQVELTPGDVKHLAGSNIEASLDSDPTVRSSGVIDQDGNFTLETLHTGVIHKGALEGTYQVRIILSDDDKASRRLAAQALAPRFLQFQTSGLSLKVPPEGDVTLLKLTQR